MSISKKTICCSVPKTLDFSQNYYIPFHRVTFDHSISGVFLIDKPNETCQNSKKIKRNAISTTTKSFQKEKEIVLHQQRQMP